MRIAIFLFAVLTTHSSIAADTLQLETRTGVQVPVYYMKRDAATATVILLPGGSGGFGQIVDGKPAGKNFLVRTRDYFSEAGFNVAVMGRASDTKNLDYADRITPVHIQDIQKMVDYAKKDSGLPVWLIGTSRGTVSATAAAIAFGNASLAGLVLTASVVSPKRIGAVPGQDLAAIRIPVLVLHHEKDACSVCEPREVPAIINGLKNAPIRKLVMVRDGADPTGEACGNQHYHGFMGIEKTAVDLIANWIKRPAP